MIDPSTQWPDETPNDPRVYVPNVEVYITNVCNISCNNCNRFNNYDFKGFQHWSDYEEKYTQWAKKIRLQKITILGGEPLLNPSICDWVRGFNRLWGKKVQILTNGTRLNQTPGLYDAMLNYRENRGNWIGVSIHNVNDTNRYFQEIHKFLQGPVKMWQGKDTVDSNGNSMTWGADYAFEDANGVHVHVWVYDSFYNASIHKNNQGLLTLHNNDPQAAHDVCGMVTFKNYHFIRANLHKCGPVALMPEFDSQHTLDISAEDRVLLNSYNPLTVDEFDQRGHEFIKHIDDVIPQCKFCPVNFTNEKLFAVSKILGSQSVFKQ
jgi:hypothetical protein